MVLFPYIFLTSWKLAISSNAFPKFPTAWRAHYSTFGLRIPILRTWVEIFIPERRAPDTQSVSSKWAVQEESLGEDRKVPRCPILPHDSAGEAPD